MKKLIITGTIAIATMSGANAGWLSDLFSKEEAEPQTLAEACNLDEITAICPEIVLGEQTLLGCVADNVKKVSSKCVNFVKKSVSENNDEIATWTEAIKSKSLDAAGTAKEEATEKSASLKEQVNEKVNAAKVEIAKKLLNSANAD